MQLSPVCFLRRIVNSPYHPFRVIPKPDPWIKRERLKRFMAWEYGQARITVRKSLMMQDKIFHWLDMNRTDALKLEQYYAKERLTASLSEHDFEYKHFRNMLDKAHILIDNIVLSQLALYEPRTFQSIVSLAREMALREGRQVLTEKEYDPVEVNIDSSIFRDPLPLPKLYAKGAAENHRIKPRKLKESEY